MNKKTPIEFPARTSSLDYHCKAKQSRVLLGLSLLYCDMAEINMGCFPLEGGLSP